MPRGSDIERAGMGGHVLRRAADGETPPEIARRMQELGRDISSASVRRYLSKQSVNAAIPDENAALERLSAAISGLGDMRDTGVSTYFGKYKLNTTNNFTSYYGIARGLGNGQVMRAFKNIALKVTNGAMLVGDEKDAEKIHALSTATNFSSLLQNVVRYTCEMGTCIVGMKSEDVFISPMILPMQYYTLLTDTETPGTVDEELVHGIVTKIVFDEMGDKKQTFDMDEVGLLRLWENGNEMTDISGRSTFGIYGESMTTGVEAPLKSLLNSSYYYDRFIEDYGLGRYVQNLKVLAELVVNKIVSPEAAKKAQEETVETMKTMGPNENIVTVGDEIRMMESRTGFDIVPYLEWRRKQIDRALLQSDVGAGDVGNAWTSSGTAVSAQDYDTYKSLRETMLEQVMEKIIIPRCVKFSIDPETLSIATTPFLRVDVPFPDLIEMCDRGHITESELRNRGGFSIEKPEEG